MRIPPAPAISAAAARLVLLGGIVATYLILATAYALKTPLWQVPDEPAHFNYVAQVADASHDPPEIEAGDHPFEELEALKAARFPPGASIANLSYEDHQPPAYYYLAAVAFNLAPPTDADQARGIRLLGVVLGTITLAAAWRAARIIAPTDTALAAGTAAFVAFLPMNLALTAAVNNDALATPLAALLLVVSLEMAAGRCRGRCAAARGGGLLGWALLTKVTLYPLAAVVAAGAAAGQGGGGKAVRRTAAPMAVALALATPWFARNVVVYGPSDPLALVRHAAVVGGEPRTADWIAQHGLGAWAARLVTFTFESFWGVFGWMGVFLAPWMYLVLAAATAAAIAGLAIVLARQVRAGEEDRAAEVLSAGAPGAVGDPGVGHRKRALATVLALDVLVVAGGFAVYNATFVQHQGRYFFPALVPIGLGIVAGVGELGRRAAIAAGRPAAAPAARAGAIAAFAAATGALALLSLQRYVVPGLTPALGATGP